MLNQEWTLNKIMTIFMKINLVFTYVKWEITSKFKQIYEGNVRKHCINFHSHFKQTHNQ